MLFMGFRAWRSRYSVGCLVAPQQESERVLCFHAPSSYFHRGLSHFRPCTSRQLNLLGAILGLLAAWVLQRAALALVGSQRGSLKFVTREHNVNTAWMQFDVPSVQSRRC